MEHTLIKNGVSFSRSSTASILAVRAQYEAPLGEMASNLVPTGRTLFTPSSMYRIKCAGTGISSFHTYSSSAILGYKEE